MASRALTNLIRQEIVDDLTKRKFGDVKAVFIDRKYVLAFKVYDELYSKDKQEKMNALPDGWLPLCSNVHIQIQDRQHTYDYLYFSGATDANGGRVEKRRTNTGSKCLIVTADSPIGQEYLELMAEYKEFEKTVFDAKVKANAIVESVNTTKQLKEVWPEITPFVEKYETVEIQTLPDVTREDLNKVFGLPVEEKEKVAA